MRSAIAIAVITSRKWGLMEPEINKTFAIMAEKKTMKKEKKMISR